MSENSRPSVLVIDDNEGDRVLAERMIRRTHEVALAGDLRSGLVLLRSRRFDCVLLDYRLPDIEGLEAIGKIGEEHRGGIVMLTGEGNESVAVAAIQRGVHDYVVKDSLTPELLGRVIESARAKALMNETLEAQKEEFRHFAFTAAHDLRAPFRKIRAYCEMLREATGDDAAETRKDLLARIDRSVGELDALVEGLLNYARMGRLVKDPARVSLDGACKQALANLQGVIEEKQAVVEVGELATVCGDSTSLTLLLQNLVANALKFNQRRPQVSIRTQIVGDRCILSVEDNGIGIGPEHYERIFKPFERLHGKSQCEGLGLGLATCKRVVEAHDGTIRVESQPGKGSRFMVSLPALPRG